MDPQHRAEIEKHRDEIMAWSQEFMQDLTLAAPVAGPLPSFKPPPAIIDAYQCILGLFDEEGIHASFIDDVPPGDLTIASVFTVIDGVNLVLNATRDA